MKFLVKHRYTLAILAWAAWVIGALYAGVEGNSADLIKDTDLKAFWGLK